MKFYLGYSDPLLLLLPLLPSRLWPVVRSHIRLDRVGLQSDPPWSASIQHDHEFHIAPVSPAATAVPSRQLSETVARGPHHFHPAHQRSRPVVSF